MKRILSLDPRRTLDDKAMGVCESGRNMVLIVDDCVDICRMLAVLFRTARIDTHTADGGRAALDWLESHCPAAIVLDVSMPDLNGLDVLDAIRTRPRLAGVPVILHTAMADPSVALVAREKGAAATISKAAPHCLANLLQMVRGFSGLPVESH